MTVRAGARASVNLKPLLNHGFMCNNAIPEPEILAKVVLLIQLVKFTLQRVAEYEADQ